MITHFRQRPPVFITAVFAFTVATSYIYDTGSAHNAIFVGALIALSVAAVVLFVRKFVYIGLFAVMLAMIPLGVLLNRQCMENELYARSLENRELSVRGMVYDIIDEVGYDIYYVRVSEVSGRSVKPFKITVRASGVYNAPSLYDKALFNVKTSGFEDGLYSNAYRENYRSKGVFLTCRGQYLRTVKEADGVLLLLRRIREFCDEAFIFTECSGFLKALVIGDRSGLSAEEYELFSDAGVSHVLALSGLHISMILLSMNMVPELVSLPKRLCAVPEVVLVLFYMALTGFSHSVVRAGFMALFSMAATLLYSRCDSLDSVCTALFIILLSDPYAIGSISLQLSFLATLGIIMLATPLMRKIRRALARFAYKKGLGIVWRLIFKGFVLLLSPIVITASVMLFGFPVMLVNFNVISTTALLSNLFIVPQVGWIITVTLIYLLTYAISPIRFAATEFIKYSLELQADIICRMVKFFAELPTPQLWVPPEYRTVFAMLCTAALTALVLYNAKLKYYGSLPLIVLYFCVSVAVILCIRPDFEVYCIKTDASEAVVLMYDGRVVIYRVEGSSQAVVEFCAVNNIHCINDFILPLPYSEYREYFDALYDEGIKIETLHHISYYFEDGEYGYYIDNRTAQSEYEYNQKFTIGAAEYEIQPRHRNSCFLRVQLGEVGFAYNLNGTKNRTLLPPYLYDSDIVVMSGETDIFYEQPLIPAQYFLYEYSKYSDIFKRVYSGDNAYDFNRHKIYIFAIRDGQISMRSMS